MFNDSSRERVPPAQSPRRELRPPHDYTLEQFGLSEAGLREQFSRYRQRFIEPQVS